MQRRSVRRGDELGLEQLQEARYVAQAAGTLRIPDLAGATARPYERGDSRGRHRGARDGKLTPHLTLRDVEAIADGALALPLLLEHGHGEVFKDEDGLRTEIDDVAVLHRTEAIRLRGKARQRHRRQERLERDPPDAAAGLSASRARAGRSRLSAPRPRA